MDDQIRRLMTNQITFDRFQRPVEISQASLMPLGVAQCHSAVDTDIPGIITMHILVFTVPSFLKAKTRFCIDSRVIRTANQAGVSPNCLQVSQGAYDARTWTFKARKRDRAFPETRKHLRRRNPFFGNLPVIGATELGIFLETLDLGDLEF